MNALLKRLLDATPGLTIQVPLSLWVTLAVYVAAADPEEELAGAQESGQLLNKENEALTSEIHAVRAQLQDARESNVRLADGTSSLEAKVSDLYQQLGAAEGARDSLRAEINALRTENNALLGRLAEREREEGTGEVPEGVFSLPAATEPEPPSFSPDWPLPPINAPYKASISPETCIKIIRLAADGLDVSDIANELSIAMQVVRGTVTTSCARYIDHARTLGLVDRERYFEAILERQRARAANSLAQPEPTAPELSAPTVAPTPAPQSVVVPVDQVPFGPALSAFGRSGLARLVAFAKDHPNLPPGRFLDKYNHGYPGLEIESADLMTHWATIRQLASLPAEIKELAS